MIETPYPGLRPFRRDEVNVFFGRDRHIDSMLKLLSANRFLAVTGSSGAGKSSLVKTGLYSALELGYMRSGGAHWQIVEARPQTHPLQELSDALVDVLGDQNDAAVRGLMQAAMSRSPESAAEVLGNIIAEKRESLLIVIDQFEELFRYEQARTDDEKYAFVAMLLELARQRTYPIYVAITVRSDFLGECSRYDGLAETVNESLFLTPQMTRDELREAIESPALVYGGTVESRLTNRILNDLEKERDQLPLMQHALARLWDIAAHDNPDAPNLTLKMYDKIEGVTGALTLHADAILGELGERAPLAERLFRQLVGRSEGADDVRRPTQLGDIAILAHAGIEELKPVIEAFRRSDRSFLAPPEGELAAETTIDITHESLIRQWPRLKDWAAKEQADAAQYRRLEESGRLYKQGNTGLWGSPDLEIALDWRERVKPTALWAARHVPNGDFEGAMAFLAESERVAAEARAKQAAAAQAEEQKRIKATRRLQRQRATLLGVVLVAMIALVLAVQQWRSASDSGEDARRNLEQAIGGQADYIVQTALARFNDGAESEALAMAGEADLFSERNGRSEITARRMERLQRALNVSRGIPLDSFGVVSTITDTSGFTGTGSWVGVARNAEELSVNVWNVETGSNELSFGIANDLWLGSISPGLKVAGVVTNKGKLGLFPLGRGSDVTWLEEPNGLEVYALSLAGTPGNELALLVAHKGAREILELWNVATPATPVLLDSLAMPELNDDYSDYMKFDSRKGRFIIQTNKGSLLVGSVASNKLSIGGFLPFRYGESSTHIFNVMPSGQSVVGLIDSCVFEADFFSAVAEETEAETGCPTDGITIELSGITGAELVSDGEFLVVANSGSRQIIDMRAGNFGTAIQQVDSLEAGRNVVDMDLIGGAAVATTAAFADKAAISEAAVPRTVFGCYGACEPIARIGDAGVLFLLGADWMMKFPSKAQRLVFAPFSDDGTLQPGPLDGSEGLTSLIGISADGKSIAVANPGWTQAAIFNLATGEKTPLAIISTRNGGTNFGGEKGPADNLLMLSLAGGLAVVWQDVPKGGTKSDVLKGVGKLSFSAPAEWPTAVAIRPAEEVESPPIIAYTAAHDWLAIADDTGLSIREGAAALPGIKNPATSAITGLEFSPNGEVLVVTTAESGIWSIRPGVAGGDPHVLLGSDRLSGAVASLDVTDTELLVLDDLNAVRVSLGDTTSVETLNGIRDKWIAAAPGGIVTMDDTLISWVWPSALTGPTQSAVAIATAPGNAISPESLQDLYFVPDALTQSFAARFGSTACAAAAPVNRGAERGIGCAGVVVETPTDPSVLLAHGLQLIQSQDISFNSFSGVVSGEGGFRTASVEEGELFLTAAAAGGDLTALAVLADRFSPAVTHAGSLLPAYGWNAAIDLLERISDAGGPLPSVVIELVSSAALDPDVVEARHVWSARVAEARYDSDPVALLARALLTERAGTDPGVSLDLYADLIPQLVRPADAGALGFAKDRFAALAHALGETRALAVLAAARQRHSAAPEAAKPKPVVLPEAMASYLAVLTTPAEAAPRRPAAVVAELLAFLDLPASETKAETPPYVEVKILTEQLNLGVAAESMAPLVTEIVARADRIEADSTANELIAGAFAAMLEKAPQAPWRDSLELAILGRFAKLYGTSTALTEQQFFAAIATVLAEGRGKAIPAELKPGFDAAEALVLGNFVAAVDGFTYDSALLEKVEQQVWTLAQVADAIGAPAAAASLAGRAVVIASDQPNRLDILDRAAVLIPRLLGDAATAESTSPWLATSWKSILAAYTSVASEFRNLSLTTEERLAQSPAQIARIEAALALDALLADTYDGGSDNYRDRALALVWEGLLYDDYGAALKGSGDWPTAEGYYRKAAEAAEEATSLRLTILPNSPDDADLLDSLRNAFSNAAVARGVLGERDAAVAAIENANFYSGEAYRAGGTNYLENYLVTSGDVLVYRIDAGDPKILDKAIEIYRRFEAFAPADLNAARSGYIAWVLRDIAYAMGADWRRMHPIQPQDQCDQQIAHPYDPMRRGPGIFLNDVADLDAAYVACKAELDKGASLTPLDEGRLRYQLGRAVYQGEQIDRPFAGEDWRSRFHQAKDLGYPAGWLGLSNDIATEDEGYAQPTVSFYNATLKALGPLLLSEYDRMGTPEAQQTAAWLREQIDGVGPALDAHRLIVPQTVR